MNSISWLVFTRSNLSHCFYGMYDHRWCLHDVRSSAGNGLRSSRAKSPESHLARNQSYVARNAELCRPIMLNNTLTSFRPCFFSSNLIKERDLLLIYRACFVSSRIKEQVLIYPACFVLSSLSPFILLFPCHYRLKNEIYCIQFIKISGDITQHFGRHDTKVTIASKGRSLTNESNHLTESSHKRKLSWELLCLVCLKLNSLSGSYWGQNMHAYQSVLKPRLEANVTLNFLFLDKSCIR